MERQQNQSYTLTFKSGFELVVHEEPIRMLYVLHNGKLVTNRFISCGELSSERSSGTCFLIDDYTEEQGVLFDFNDYELNFILEKLETLEDNPEKFSLALKMVDGIEQDYSDRRGLRQEWESTLSDGEQGRAKMKWAFLIASQFNFSEVERCVSDIPKFVVNELSSVKGMGSQWNQIDEDIQGEILETWGEIVRKHLA